MCDDGCIHLSPVATQKGGAVSRRCWLVSLMLVPLLIAGVSTVRGEDDLPATIVALQTEVAELQGHGTPVPAVASSPVAPAPGELLYVADTSGGFEAWSLPGPQEGYSLPDWSVQQGMLVSLGYGKGEPVSAPFTAPSDDYAVQVEAQILRFNPDPEVGVSDFLIMARGGVFAGVGTPCRREVTPPALHIDAFLCGFLIGEEFDPGQGWHTYRLEVEGNQIRLFVDGELRLAERSNRVLTGEKVGLISYRVELGIRRFAVYSLLPNE